MDGSVADAAAPDASLPDTGPVGVDAGDGGTVVPDSGCAETTVEQVWGDASGSDWPGTVRDTWINLNPEMHASDVNLRLYTWPTAQVANAILMQWDISAIPAGATIVGASLELYQSEGVGASYQTTVHEVVNCAPDIAADQVTGFQCSAGNPWTPNPCCTRGVPMGQADIGPAVDTQSLDTANGYKAFMVTPMIQHWLDEPSANLGVMINSDPAAPADDQRTFRSSEFASADQRPRLTVRYLICE